MDQMRRVDLRSQTSVLPARREAGSVGASDGEKGSDNLQAAIDSLTKYDDAEYDDQLELVGASIFFEAPIFQRKPSPAGKSAEVSQARNTLRKPELTDKERTVFAVLEQWRRNQPLSVWMSRSLPVDMNLPVTYPCPLRDTLQALVLCVGRPALVLSLYKLDQSAVQDFLETVQQFTVETASKMTSHLHDFCHCDFMLLPCTLEYESFCLQDLEKAVGNQRCAVRPYFGGRIDLNSSFYTSMRAAADAIASVSYVPRIMPDVNSSRPLCKKPWLLRLDDPWRDLLSLFIERLEQSELDLELTFTESTDYKSKVALLEAARRLSFRDRVVLITTDERIISCKWELETYTGKEHKPQMKLRIVEEVPQDTDQDDLFIRIASCFSTPAKVEPRDVKPQVHRQTFDSVLFHSRRGGTFNAEILEMKWTQPNPEEETTRKLLVLSTTNLKDENTIWDELSSKEKTGCLRDLSQRLLREVEVLLLRIDYKLNFILAAPDAAEKGERDKRVAKILAALLPEHIRSEVEWSTKSLNKDGHVLHIKLGKLQAFDPASEQRSPQLAQQGPSTGPQQQVYRPGQQRTHSTSTEQQQAQGTSTISQPALVAAAEASWRQSVRHWYPNLHGQTYFLPPIHANQVSYDVETVAGQFILVPQAAPNQPGQAPAYFPVIGPPPHPSDPPLAAGIWPHFQVVPPGLLPVVQDADSRYDHAIQRVRNYILDLVEREQEVMLVLFQLEFRKYLDNQVNPITAAAICLLPRPATLGRKFADGDFDVLMINSRYGLIVGEMKSVGADLSKTPDLDKAVVKAVEKAIVQLNKEEAVLRHLVSDLAHINITKTLMLPNVTSTQLLNALNINPMVKKDLCVCVGVSDSAAAVSCCLTADAMSCGSWWHRAVTDKGLDLSMTPDLYEVLVARFCGPATTVEVPTVTTVRRAVPLRTMSEAVALTGLTTAMLALYPEQVELVNRPGLPRVFLWGPPGTGKTVILVIKGMQWRRQGKDVHLLSTHRHSRAAILLIERQLQHSLEVGFTSTSLSTSTPAPGPRVYTHFYYFEDNKGDVEAAVEKLASAARDRELFIIVDEAFGGGDYSTDGGDDTSFRFAAFCAQLAARVPELHLWAAAVERHVSSACLREERVTTPVRCPLAVLRQVERSSWIDDVFIPRYSNSSPPAPTDGPAVREIRHWDEHSLSHTPSLGHTGDRPECCECCADHIAHLMEELQAGQQGSDVQYRDCIILCDNPCDDLPVVNRLHALNVPVQVVRSKDDEAAIRDLALAERDAVTVTDWNVVRGLERRVVVVMGVCVNDDDRLHAMSRSTSLLVWAGESLQSDDGGDNNDDDDDDDEEEEGEGDGDDNVGVA